MRDAWPNVSSVFFAWVLTPVVEGLLKTYVHPVADGSITGGRAEVARLVGAFPVIVRGIDVQGQRFEIETSS